MTTDLPATLATVPANQSVLSILSAAAVPRPADDPWALDGFESHAHPDLGQRLDELAVGMPGGRTAGLYGVPVLVAGGVVYAVARGTSTIHLRIPSGPSRVEILEHPRGAVSEFGTAWVAADAWLSDLSGAEGTRRLRSWIAAAASMVSVDA